ncbi:acyltransferase family protein [Paraburkholderia flagellata]|uniref:acyltransferase family protein n=1 Tax=Paraburkholderia flagellata TaxID=2883241 RepID=UPI001F4491AC|nr:acyltransferase [Paraburkholderia flagellata]
MQIDGLHLLFGAAFVIAIAFMASAIVARSNFYGLLIERETSSKRFHAIDGLRGYLALGVLLHHVVINAQLYQIGSWALTPSRLNTFLGRGSVAFFFMITAFLFWGRMIDGHGKIDTLRFYASRIRRLVPMYLISAGLLIATALTFTHFRIVVPIGDLASQIASWLLFTIPGAPEVNGFKQTGLVNTVFWSLVYEWKFYIALPFVAALAMNGRAWLAAAGVSITIALFSTTQIEWFFLGGCVAACAVRSQALQSWAPRPVGSFVAFACIAATALYQPMTYTWLGAVLLFIPFLLFAGGNSLFGVLTCRPARLLGLLSYSVYLLHNWVLYLVSRMVNHYTPIADLTLGRYWAVVGAVALITVALAAITYRFVEHPRIRPAKKTQVRSMGSVPA